MKREGRKTVRLDYEAKQIRLTIPRRSCTERTGSLDNFGRSIADFRLGRKTNA
jgi:hypothetical protein